ncbi:MAG: glycosyltransferase [Bacteroidetes bacterium]|nr:glycosyltransferase [Bacteroidota bacterium]
MKKTIKIKFTDFWTESLDGIFLYNLLKEHFPIEISETPDVLIYSVYSHNHINYNCKKVYFTAENTVPDYRFCDYSIGFNHDEANNRHIRYPLFLFYGDINSLIKKETITTDMLKAKTEFCTFVVSNASALERIEFFKKLDAVKRVDSAGKAMNNMPNGWSIPKGEKYQYIRKYKFNIAFENSATAGYTTEKIFEPMECLTTPIYWGDPLVTKDFNPASFVHIRDYANYDEAIKDIIAIDADDERYLKMMNEPYLIGNRVPEHLKVDRLIEFFEKVFYGDSITPVSSTKEFLYNKMTFKTKVLLQKIPAKLKQMMR